MTIECPGCRTKFSFDDQRVGADGVKLRCGRCKAVFRIIRKSGAPPPLSGADAHTSVRAKGISVVVANESETFCRSVKDALAGEPYEVSAFRDGREAYDYILRTRPDVVLLDVALPSMYGFEVCEAIRKAPELSSVKVILIASIYDKTKYKREPVSLYGADDYIEKHHIPDLLAAMVNRLVSERKTAEPAVGSADAVEEEVQAAPQIFTPGELEEQEAARLVLRNDEENKTSFPVPDSAPELSEAQVKAKRFARLIVSDIALYNQAKVEEGVKNGSFYELLADEIAEGKSLFLSRVPGDVIDGTSFMDEAFEELISTKRQELGF